MTSLTATNDAICEAWEGSLLLPSRKDTPETALALTQQRKTQEAACV